MCVSSCPAPYTVPMHVRQSSMVGWYSSTCRADWSMPYFFLSMEDARLRTSCPSASSSAEVTMDGTKLNKYDCAFRINAKLYCIYNLSNVHADGARLFRVVFRGTVLANAQSSVNGCALMYAYKPCTYMLPTCQVYAQTT